MKPISEKELIEHSFEKSSARVSLAQIEQTIASEHYFTALDGAVGEEIMRGLKPDYHPMDLAYLTLCVLRLKNGFTVLGKSACADPKSFDKELGRKIAREDAINQMWPLLGYELKSRIHKDLAHG